jgi:nucleotidyltransferase/DNA polymerase involved in DNA repair
VLLGDIADDLDRYTPMVALDPPDGLILDITGCERLWEMESHLVSDLAARLAHHGFTLRLALAETPDRARALARHGGEMLRVGRRTPPGMLNEERAGYSALGKSHLECPVGNPPLRGEVARAPFLGRATEGCHSLQKRRQIPERLLKGGYPSDPFQGPPPLRGEDFATHAIALYTPPLPIAALDLDDARATALRRAGLSTIEDLASRPRAALAARFGRKLVDKLACVLGEQDIRITPRRTAPALFFTRRFAEPIAHSDRVLAAMRALAEEARTALLERGEGGRRFTLSLFRSDGETHRLTIETGAPTRDPALLDRLFRERIDALHDPLDPGFGYDALRLDVAITEPLEAAQIGLVGDGAGEVAQQQVVTALLDRIGVRLGQNRIRRMMSGNSHIPELAAFTTAANAPALPLPWSSAEPGEPPLRPLHLFDPPHRVEVIAEVPDGPPRRFRWRRQMHDVVAHEGPERIASEWWRRRDMRGLTRDYFRVEDSKGRRFWLFRHGLYGAEKASPDWYLHGLFV